MPIVVSRGRSGRFTLQPTRRLIKSLGDSALNSPSYSKVYIDYHREALVDPARTRGFGVEFGRDISDFQLLAKLQHFGAATGLLDFTWNPLVALWFASREPDSDGKVFVLRVTDAIRVAKMPSDAAKQTIDAVFNRADNTPVLFYWEPMWSGDAMPRILRQRGVFVIGRPLVPMDSLIVEEIEILEADKTELLNDLALLDVNEPSLFPDIFGFSSLENATTATRVSSPQFYFVQANQLYQAADYTSAIVAYDNCVDLSPGVGELYLLRGNAKSEAKLYRDAVEDFRQVIAHKDQPFLELGTIANPTIVDLILFMAYFNCGNALAELSDYEAAIASYSDAIRIERSEIGGRNQALFNRGNIHLILGHVEKAISDYDSALALQPRNETAGGILYNKANALVISGRFAEALVCYNSAEQTNVLARDSSQNLEALKRIMAAAGPREYQTRFL